MNAYPDSFDQISFDKIDPTSFVLVKFSIKFLFVSLKILTTRNWGVYKMKRMPVHWLASKFSQTVKPVTDVCICR